LILNQEKERVKLNKCVVIKSKMMNGYKLFVCIGNMKNLIEVEKASGGGYDRLTNVINIHTFLISSPDLIIALVPLMHHQLLKFTGDMMRSTRVEVPVWVIGRGGSNRNVIIWSMGLIKPIPANGSCVPNLVAHLALRTVLIVAGIGRRTRVVVVVGIVGVATSRPS
jgi:hypothetical protein